MTVQKKIPALRFPKFDGEWEEKRLGNISKNIAYGMNAAATDYDGKHKYLRITDIDDESGIFVPNPLTSPKGDIFDKYKLEKGDLVFARTGASVGKSYLYNLLDGKLYYAGFLIRFSIDKANPYFIFLQTQLSKYRKWVKVYSMRSGQPGINAEEYKSYKVLLPSSNEQQKIASFLSKIDKRISLLKQKQDTLSQYKKGVMQQLFSQQIRFTKADGTAFPDWEERKLGDIGHFYYGKSAPKWSVSADALTPCVRYGELYSTYDVFISKIKSYTNIDPKKLKFSKGGEILVPRVGEDPLDFANCSYLPIANVAIGEMISVFNTEEHGIFLTYFFNSTLKKAFARVVEGGSVANLYFKYLEPIVVNIPCYEEQEKIASFLMTIDKKIQQTKTQIAQNKQYKKGLLQQMFV